MVIYSSLLDIHVHLQGGLLTYILLIPLSSVSCVYMKRYATDMNCGAVVCHEAKGTHDSLMAPSVHLRAPKKLKGKCKIGRASCRERVL